jgi:hypothetical protein
MRIVAALPASQRHFFAFPRAPEQESVALTRSAHSFRAPRPRQARESSRPNKLALLVPATTHARRRPRHDAPQPTQTFKSP